MTGDEPLLELAELVMRYELGPGIDPLTVLAGIDLVLGAGETVAVVGPSGSGKSTLLHVAAGLVSPTSGRVRLDGRDLADLGAEDRAALRNRTIGLVFQDHHLLPQCTVLENVLVPTLAGWDVPPDAAERARALCERVGLADRLTHRPARLSWGERQRVAVVRALINEPRLLFADEPTGSLDARTSAELTDLFCELQEEMGLALLVVTHAASLTERMGRVLELEDGRLRAVEAMS